MIESHFALARGEPKRLKVEWGYGGPARVFLDSNEIARTGSDPPEYRLPDGSVIALFSNDGKLDILHDGERLPGSRFDPQHQLFVAVATLLLIAAAHFAVWWITRQHPLPRDLRLNQLADWTPAAGLFYLVIGVLLYRRSRVALYIAMAAWFVEATYLVIVSAFYDRTMRRHRSFFLLYLPIGLLLTADDALAQLKPRKRASPEVPYSIAPHEPS
jgi:hypothetical protein